MSINGDKSREIEELREKIVALELENKRLRQTCQQGYLAENGFAKEYMLHETGGGNASQELSREEIERYSRQLLLHGGFGVKGQKKLLAARVLVVGAGGIGSTVIPYLAACGVGHLTIVDFDEVDVSNLHRQVMHKTVDVGMNKAESAYRVVKQLNPSIHCEILRVPLTTSNAIGIIQGHDCVIDASDNPQTRYSINDACVLAGRPLISGSAIGFEGQCTVYNFEDGPCYRCLYPKPNTSEGSKSCSDHGVLGPVPGLIGVLQAVEAIKVLTSMSGVMNGYLVMYDAIQCSFLRIKKPPRQMKCPICGPNPTIKSMEESEKASEGARGPSCTSYNLELPELAESQHITPEEYDNIRRQGKAHILLDVRVPEQFDICSMDDAINIPLKTLTNRLEEVEGLSDGTKPVFCLCRRGVASVLATHQINERMKEYPKIHSVVNIRGGLDAWRKKVDTSFPKY